MDSLTGDPGPAADAVLGTRMVRFRLQRGEYGIRLQFVSGLVAPGPLHPVPGAPEEILGLMQCRSHLLTVLDLPALLEDPGNDEPGCLIRLASPLASTALFVPAAVRLETLDPRNLEPDPGHGPPYEGEVRGSGPAVVLLRPSAFVSRLDHAIRSGRVI